MSRKTRTFRRGARRGFTLIEVIVTIAIIATLASVVAPVVFGHVSDARISAAKSQVESLSLALESYNLDNATYPVTEQGLDALREPPPTGQPPRNWRGPYLQKIVPIDPWGRRYEYLSPGKANPLSYDLYSFGKDGSAGGTGEDADITSWGGSVVR